jgi:uncharacterized membrane protein YqjE
MSNLRAGHNSGTVTNALIAQAGLYIQLAAVEWKEEKIRLTAMLVCLLLGFTFLFCLLLTFSVWALLYSWETPYRFWSLAGLVCVYGLGVGYSGYRFRALGRQSDKAFADTREELAIDIALLRNRLE